MYFNSIHYIVFLPIVIILYYGLPSRYRWSMLLFASYYFIMCWKAEYVLLVALSSTLDYLLARWIATSISKSTRMGFLCISLACNLGLLLGFKYLNFFNDSVRFLIENINVFYNVSTFHIFLPIGISFYTLQKLSYIIDVYRGAQKPEYHWGYFCLYVAYFPQLVAGPIERSGRLLPQLRSKHQFDYTQVTEGFRLILWGLFLKVAVADRVAPFVDQVYQAPELYTGPSFTMATFFFACQIFCDFAGYSCIAIGTARTMGVELMQNFRRPYFAKSVGEFWQRWHISLSTWFRDYLYIPLGGNRVSRRRWVLNIFIVFLISGLWHGANWTFIIWGALNGIYLLIEIVFGVFISRLESKSLIKKTCSLLDVLRIPLTFVMICFSWIFFRANSTDDAFFIVSRLGTGWLDLLQQIGDEAYVRDTLLLGLGKFFFIVTLFFVAAVFIVEFVQEKRLLRRPFPEQPIWIRWTAYYVLTIAILIFGAYNTNQQFIYFQF